MYKNKIMKITKKYLDNIKIKNLQLVVERNELNSEILNLKSELSNIKNKNENLINENFNLIKFKDEYLELRHRIRENIYHTNNRILYLKNLNPNNFVSSNTKELIDRLENKSLDFNLLLFNLEVDTKKSNQIDASTNIANKYLKK